MRIAYLTGRYPAVSHTFITREVRALRERGVEVHTAAIWPTDERELLSEADREERRATFTLLPFRPGRHVRAHGRALLTRPRRYLRTARLALHLSTPGVRGRALAAAWMLEAIDLWDHCRSLDVRHVHAHLNGSAPSVALLLAAFADDSSRGGERWTWSMTVHGPAEFYDVARERLAEKVRRATFVVCISDFARSQLMALVDEREWGKLRLVHCGVDPTAFHVENRPARNGGPLRVLNVGRLARTKGHAVLISAFADLRRRGVEATLTIVGDGPKRADLEKLARRAGLAEHVRFAGAVGQDRIRSYFEDADVFCTTSFAEGVPVVLMEAMAMELPVVAPAIMGIGELVKDGVSGLLTPPSRPDRVAEALQVLARDPARSRELAVRGREAVLAAFDVRRSAAELERILREYVER
jgi:glycosyltransferase involved in cell wall biosynthesis